MQNIQSTNWQTMRFKPPPPNSPIGWRVEFRPCEAQLTDFENAAYVCFVVLLTRVILSYRLNFVMPISKVRQNVYVKTTFYHTYTCLRCRTNELQTGGVEMVRSFWSHSLHIFSTCLCSMFRWMRTCNAHKDGTRVWARSSGGAATWAPPPTSPSKPETRRSCTLRWPSTKLLMER